MAPRLRYRGYPGQHGFEPTVWLAWPADTNESAVQMASMSVHGFLPSTYALHFSNDFPPGPLFRLGSGPIRIPVGNAANGLCGGMVFAARDLFESNATAPPDRAPPAGGTTLFRYLVRRLFASFDLPTGPLRYWLWMARPTGDGRLGRGLTRQTIDREWPRVKADLERGALPPLGLIRTRSLNPLSLGLNHQVLAFGYDSDDQAGTVAINVYDPNHPDEDALVIMLHLSGPHPRIDYIEGEAPVRGFFRTRYRPPRSRSRRLLSQARTT
jgi:hypothetical protein